MRHKAIAAVLTLGLAASPLLSAQAAQSSKPAQPAPPAQAVAPGDAAADADILEYIRLYGYREMLEQSAKSNLDAIIEMTRLTRPGLQPGVLEVIRLELEAELGAAADESVAEMAAVFKRHLNRGDIAYLNSVGRDPRMQKVIRLQPAMSRDLEEIGERLGERVTSRAAPRIEERLRKLQGGQEG